jgi:lysozyme
MFRHGIYSGGTIPVWAVDRGGRVDFSRPIRRLTEAEALALLRPQPAPPAPSAPPPPAAPPPPSIQQPAPKPPLPAPPQPPAPAPGWWRRLLSFFTTTIRKD